MRAGPPGPAAVPADRQRGGHGHWRLPRKSPDASELRPSAQPVALVVVQIGLVPAVEVVDRSPGVGRLLPGHERLHGGEAVRVEGIAVAHLSAALNALRFDDELADQLQYVLELSAVAA